MTPLRIHLFGSLSLFWDDQPLPPVPGTAARSLLAYLVTYRAQPHTRDLLAGTFWPDLPDTVARRRLSQALWQIRRALAPVRDALDVDVLLAEGDTVQLNPHLPLWLDVDEFLVKSQIPNPKAQSGESGVGVWGLGFGILRDAVALYRGEFLAGYYDDWVLTERERLREILLQVLERLIDACKAQGEYEEALVYARQLVGQDPWREEAHCEV
ncbi:MAG: BTAD domain-containing putative transcriptional regulator, partial [Promethearchaeota archaeon]